MAQSPTSVPLPGSIAEEFGERVAQVQLLPFRKLGEDKYEALGMRYPMRDFVAPPRESWEPELQLAASIMSGYGLHAVAGAADTVGVSGGGR
jgi:pyruvate formate lyase activating enzyme